MDRRRIQPSPLSLQIHRWHSNNGQTSKWFFNPFDCDSDANEHAHGHVMMVTRDIPFPTSLELQYMIYLYLLEKNIRLLSFRKCLGCTHETVSGHRGFGCQGQWKQLIHHNLLEAMLEISEEHITHLLFKCYTFLGVDKPLQYWIFTRPSPETLLSAMTVCLLPDYFWDLFSSVEVMEYE